MITLWLVRHAPTLWNHESRLIGSTDLGLSDQGISLARGLATELAVIRADAAWSSDLRRCVQTAHHAGFTPMLDARLRELDFGALEGLTFDECSPEQQAALAQYDDFSAPGGESVPRLRQRVLGFIAALTPGSHLIFTHGGVIRLLLRAAGRTDWPEPATILRLDWDPRFASAAGTPDPGS